MAADDLAMQGAMLLIYYSLAIRMVANATKNKVNPLRAKLFKGNINIHLHFVSFLHIDTTQVVEILPQIRQEPAYCT